MVLGGRDQPGKALGDGDESFWSVVGEEGGVALGGGAESFWSVDGEEGGVALGGGDESFWSVDGEEGVVAVVQVRVGEEDGVALADRDADLDRPFWLARVRVGEDDGVAGMGRDRPVWPARVRVGTPSMFLRLHTPSGQTCDAAQVSLQ